MPLTHNMLWTWDARMRWVPGKETHGTSDMARPDNHFPYPYDKNFFVENYKALIRAVSDWPEIRYIIIWGFLRDSHGGVDAALEIAHFAADHGVGILAGVGTSGYGGVYYEGRHDYNARSFMRKRPDLVVSNRQHTERGIIDRGDTLNPVHPDVIAWLQEGIRWMLDTFPICGVNLEIGDLFVGHSPMAAMQRDEIRNVKSEFFKALAAQYRLLTPSLIANWPERLFTFATYSDCNAGILQENERFLDYLPEALACQWTLTSARERDGATFEGSSRLHVGYSHLFCHANRTDQSDLTPEIAALCRIADQRSLNGVIIYGEHPSHSGFGAINYAALRRFIIDPYEEIPVAQKQRIAVPI